MHDDFDAFHSAMRRAMQSPNRGHEFLIANRSVRKIMDSVDRQIESEKQSFSLKGLFPTLRSK